ncbi:hypothetical protein M0804_002652 [Polistes exclamans]|nr:hypothetical protein M0804_002652 [Polistes exclamans]
MTSSYGQTYQEEMLSMVEEPNYYNQLGEIASFYSGKKIFITGGLGFLGRLIVEKLLRCCPEITMVYLLIRPKNQKDMLTRFKEYFNNVVFDRLKKEQKDAEKKIVLIKGNMDELNLGLSEEDRERIKDTNVIIHSAASVRFVDNIRLLVNTNIKGTKNLLLLAQEMPNLKAFVHVSTAYSQCINKNIEEKFYKPPLKTEDIINLTEILNEEQLDIITPNLIGKWPNTYTYTKAISEDTVRQYSNGIPTCIVRPSMIISTEKEPIAGWINNLYGLMGFAAGIYLGIIHTIHADKNICLDIVPADYVTNNIIVAAWDCAQRGSVSPSIIDSDNSSSDGKEILIYNMISSAQKRRSLSELSLGYFKVGFKVPVMKTLSYYFLIFTKSKYLYYFYAIIFHWIPALFIDSLAYLTGKKPILLNLHKKIFKFCRVMTYFTTREWKFANDNVLHLWDKLSVSDKYNFFFNIADLDWDSYNYAYIRGLRIFILKDPMETKEKALIRLKK